MAKAARSSALEDLDLSGEEVQRLTSAFQDPEFRRMFSEYAHELHDPENRRRYEEEITALERERGVEVRFVHPEPGHALRTSVDGERRCFVNVCSNSLVGAPRSRPGPRRHGAAARSHWSLPYSLAPGRQYAGRNGARYTVYDVVFHPDALALAARHARFREMLDRTALEAVEQHFGVQLDRRNAKTLKIKYKGTPEAAVLRSPLPGGAPVPADGEPPGPLPDLPYPYRYPAAPEPPAAAAAPPAPGPAEPAPRPAPTEPRCRVVQRHRVDLQDYRCARDSVPSPVPHELVVTVELPLLRSAEQAALEVTGKLLRLDSRDPDYRLRLSLPYPVDDSRGQAQFNKARRQLVVTLPVAPAAARPQPPAAPEEAAAAPGTDGASDAPAREGRGAGGAGDPTGDPDVSEVAPPRAGAEPDFAPPPGERDRGECVASPPGPGPEPASGAGSPPETRGAPHGEPGARTPGEPAGRAMGGRGTEGRDPVCPPLQCSQDEGALTLLLPVTGILPPSLQGDLSPLRYKLSFATQDSVYSFLLQFAPENRLSAQDPAISISPNNAVIVLAKSPESQGHWREWYCGLNDASLEERLFVSEENVNEFLEVLNSPLKQTVPPTPPLIEVLQVTDEKIQIQAKLKECRNPSELQEKENRANEGCHVTRKDNTEHRTTSTPDSNSSLAVKAPKIDTCGLAVGSQQESLGTAQMPFGKSQQPEAKVKPEFIEENSTIYSPEEKDNLKEPVITKAKEVDGDHPSSLLNKTTVQSIPSFDSIKETNMRDGNVQIIKDHTTHCAFSFQNSLLYDLD